LNAAKDAPDIRRHAGHADPDPPQNTKPLKEGPRAHRGVSLTLRDPRRSEGRKGPRAAAAPEEIEKTKQDRE
jgi:hypothetical protein